MYIPNDDTQNFVDYIDYNMWLERLDTKLNKPTNQK